MRRLKKDKMHIKSYMIMLRDIKFFNEDFTMREGRLAYVWSKTKVIDEVASNEGSFFLNRLIPFFFIIFRLVLLDQRRDQRKRETSRN